MPSIKIPTPLRPFTGNQPQVTVAGDTVGAALNDLTTQYPELRQHLFNGGELRNFVNVYLGEEDVRFLGGLDTDLSPSDSLRIIPSIAGG
ncbi:MAG TPA: MoaD/ThiS family protein [Phototrophicaceae bacterium]|nr:MoaD/ThiS family protein [Phototrophicaceae bacterium]